ncbi:uncharacterized protein LOC116920196 isoform X2 [Daphnia magna]|uniref:uncharacterized protein LOC116920196 isoform X2 n=1 Tax=Daphnia magna TaxID=35525 RepID=UPI001E1BA53D|nr:uncharacterized protein LOC116920196 isoform X2 [Daphnia magna]XP_045030861.1 uncharacterized protein LOC116920196 isoform X2 [Daphnia magna]XP_045030864.1 uncharacterized protein LOC116920196 isoform X2 [Daphnia magna]XP_045030872.1 uncharacterized protein LOC116920196 isoform X2 [Daphnia magna]
MADAEQPEPAEDFLFKGKRLDCKKKIFGEGFFLFDGYWKENENAGAEKERVKSKTSNLKKEAAIRRIKNEDCLDGWKDVADKLVKDNLNNTTHNNILRVFCYEEDVANEWRYFALEPYSATLYEYCTGRYKGAMPNQSQVLYQIVNGICYLHENGIIHGDLNPLNVVVAAHSQPVRMKISDSRLTKFSYSKQLPELMKRSEERMIGDGTSLKSLELCQSKYWTMSGQKDVVEKHVNDDFVAAGCLLFYYLKSAKHVFGDDLESILKNLKEKNPVNLKELSNNHVAYDPIQRMIIPASNGLNPLPTNKKKFEEALSLQVTNKLLGQGFFGDVFEGKFNGDLVAVKEMTKTTSLKQTIQREMSTHKELNHANVVKLLDVADSADNRFTHLVLELCTGTLTDYCEKKYNGPKLPPDELVLYQIANGLHYIHSRNLVHRDIKPDNILISMTSPVQMKVSDLSFVKKTHLDIFSQSEIRGTLQWMAPERLKVLSDPENMPAELPDGTIKSDTFSSGCLFFYFLTRGKHPFGKNKVSVPANILLNKPEELDNYKKHLAADDVNGRILAHLIEDMIQFEEKERIGLPEVIKQLAAVLDGMDKSKCQLSLVDVSLGGNYRISSHPTELILAWANEKKLIFYTAENLAVPFSNWRKKKEEVTYQRPNFVRLLEWNINGTQLAARFEGGTVVVWSYPECKILFQKKIPDLIEEINWNPTRPNLFAAYHKFLPPFYDLTIQGDCQVFVCDSSIGDVITTIDCKNVSAVKWISENRIAVSSSGGKIEIFEMEENNLTTTRLVKEFKHGKGCYNLEWNERTQYLASGGDYQINIWSMDHDWPIYRLRCPLDDGGKKIAWRLCTGNGEEEGGIEMARKSAKNFTFAYYGFFSFSTSPRQGVSIWNPLEREQQPRRLSEDTRIETVDFSSDGRFLVARGNENLMIWSTEDWVQIYVNTKKTYRPKKNISFFTTKSTNLYENKLTVNYEYGDCSLFEFAFEESNISELAS